MPKSAKPSGDRSAARWPAPARFAAAGRGSVHPPGRHSLLLDRILPALGRAADYGVLWAAAGGGMALTRDPRARRAALRGLIALAVASPLTNLAGKNLVRRPRPPTTAVPHTRRLTRSPVTSSFPSGHAASAAAFATGVALEAPLRLAVPVAGTAAAVAASRVVTGAHYPSDVLAGAVLGVGAGLLSLWWWPRHPRGPAHASRPTCPAPATRTGTGVIIVVNAAAGSADDELVDTLTAELPDAEITSVDPAENLDAVLEEAAERARILGIAGGDGSVNTAARHALEHGVPLLVIPAGTFNHFARELGVDTVAAALAAVRQGSAVHVDVGRVDGQVFLNTCSLGLYADLVRLRERWEPSIGKWPALLAGLAYLLHRRQSQPVTIDGHQRRVWMLFAGNGRYRPAGLAPAYRPRLDDRHLDIRIVDATVPLAGPWVVLAALTHTLPWCRAYQGRAPRELHLARTDVTHLPLSIDGQSARVTGAVTLSIDRRSLLVYRPEKVRA